MATGDTAAAAGLAVFPDTQDVNQGSNNDNIRGDELGAHMLTGTHPASAITTGTLALARIPVLDAAHVPDLDAAKIVTGTLDAARVPGLDGGKIVSGTVAAVVSSPGNVTAANDVTATNTLRGNNIQVNSSAVNFPGARATPVSTGYVAAYLDSVGRLGASPSSRRFKQNIKRWEPDLQAAFAVEVATFRLKAAVKEHGADAPYHVGVIAEELDALGLTWLVAYDDKGRPFSVHHELVIYLYIPVIHSLNDRITALEAREN